MSAGNAVCIIDAKAEVAECPVWCADEQALYWIDIYGHRLNRFDPATGAQRSWDVGEPIGSYALRERGGFLVALKSGLYTFEPATGARELLASPEAGRPENRLNDGRCDRAGRFWVGSMRDPPRPPVRSAALYRFDAARGCARVVGDLIIANGLGFSPDDRTLYLADTHRSVRTVWAFDFDAAEGSIRNRRVFVDTRGLAGRPDGAAVDAAGCYWMTATDGGELIRFTPRAKIDRRIRLPVRNPSMLCFGGPDLKTIYVTSNRRPGVDHGDEALAGGLFAIEQDVQGLPEPRFKG